MQEQVPGKIPATADLCIASQEVLISDSRGSGLAVSLNGGACSVVGDQYTVFSGSGLSRPPDSSVAEFVFGAVRVARRRVPHQTAGGVAYAGEGATTFAVSVSDHCDVLRWSLRWRRSNALFRLARR